MVLNLVKYGDFKMEINIEEGSIKSIVFCCSSLSKSYLNRKLNIQINNSTTVYRNPETVLFRDEIIHYCPFCGFGINFTTR